MRAADYTNGADALAEVFTGLTGIAYLLPVTLVLSMLLPIVVRPLLQRLGVIDIPNERSSHERPVLRGLGLAVLIAMALAGILGLWLLTVTDVAVGESQVFVIVAIGGVLAGMLGLSEDLHGLSVPIRSLFLILLAGTVAVTLILVTEISRGGVVLALTDSASISGIQLWALILLAIYAVLFVSSYINVANFMDGLNGISGFHGVISGLSFMMAGVFAGQSWLIFTGVILAAAFAGFLPWNLSQPGAFLGDVGSYLLGGAIAITSFAALLSGVPLLATIGPMVIYFGDVGVTLVKRVRTGHKWDEPHKEHVYQRLQQAGLSHAAASGVNAVFAIAASVLGLVSFFVSLSWWFALLALGLALVVLYARLPKLLVRR